ncbi:hypothetical protein, partial [Streptomyces sulfonofaciens]|uniref:hypothetical protein n=1 Tax=Streptomyces sulfonofaciens TaxID=68272 RepID=UPI001E35FBAF
MAWMPRLQGFARSPSVRAVVPNTVLITPAAGGGGHRSTGARRQLYQFGEDFLHLFAQRRVRRAGPARPQAKARWTAGSWTTGGKGASAGAGRGPAGAPAVHPAVCRARSGVPVRGRGTAHLDGRRRCGQRPPMPRAVAERWYLMSEVMRVS